MTDELKNTENQEPIEEESPYEAYGWEFHKKPILYAAIMTALLYAFIFIYIRV